MATPERSTGSTSTEASLPGAKPDSTPAGPVLVLTRAFDAPRDLVFRAWTEPEHFARWFGPKGSLVPFCEMDVRPGGILHFCHRFPGGDGDGVVRAGYASGDIWVKGVYLEVVEPERLVFTIGFSDEAGNVVERPGFSLESQVTATFTEDGSGTRVTVRQTGLVADQGELQGWNEGLDRLQEYLAGA